MLQVAPIVEGHGEVHAVPELIRRIAAHSAPGTPLQVLPAIRVSRNRVVKPNVLERYVELAENAENHNYMRTSIVIFANQNRTGHVPRQTSASACLEKSATL